MIEETLGRSSALTIASRNRRSTASDPGPAAFNASDRRTELRRGEPLGQRPAPLGGEQQPLAAIGAARLLHDIALVDQLLQHARQALLGDGEDVEQVGDAQARMAIDEMQHAVMRAAEAEILEDGVGIAGEIAIGEEQQLGEFEQLRLGQGALARRAAAIAARLSALPRGGFSAVSRGSVRSVMLTYFRARLCQPC